MKSLILILATITLCSPLTHGVEYIDSITEAKDKANKQATDYTIYAYGGTWDHLGTQLKKDLWDQNASFADASHNIIASNIIIPEGLSKEEQKAFNGKNKDFKEPIRSLPCIFLFDSKGFCYFSVFGDGIPLTPQGVSTLLKSKQELRKQRDDLLEQAQNKQGVDKAKLLGRAAAIEGINRDKKIVEEIKKIDPTDSTGYTRRFSFSAWQLHQYLDVKKSGDAGLKIIDDMVNDNAYTPEQKQEMLGVKSTLQRRLKRPKPEIRATFEQIKKLNPSSIWGKSAPKAIKLYAE